MNVKGSDFSLFRKTLIMPIEHFFGHFWHVPNISCFIALFLPEDLQFH